MLRHHELQPAGHGPGQMIIQGPKNSDRPNPLAIPEILCMLSEYFDQQTILAALKVSRSWRTIFSPYFWKDVQLDMTTPERRPPHYVVYQNSGSIHSLHLRCKETIILSHGTGTYFFPTCAKLSRLTVEKLGTGHDKTLSKFILQQSSFLTSVSMTSTMDPPESSSELLHALAQCVNLRQLEYVGVRLTEPSEWMTLYQTLWSRLDVLVLSGDWYSRENLQDPVMIVHPEETEAVLQKRFRPAQIRDLTIEGTNVDTAKAQAQCWIIEQSSTTLTRLRWNFKNILWSVDISPMHWVYVTTSKGLCPKLETLLMPGTTFYDNDFAGLVKRMTRLTEIDLSSTNFGDRNWLAMQLQPWHLGMIRVMHLEDCKDLSGKSIQQMLCSMVSLVSFKAGGLSGTDILEDPRPWVCRDLKELILTISLGRFPPHPPQSQRMIQSRLGSLVKLEICQLNRPNKGSFRMTLQSGLEMLGKLRRLKRIHVQCSEDAPWAMWREQEVEWVLKHWPFLEELSGIFLNAPARHLLYRHKVRYSFSQFTS